jgi:hypothetical protein
MEVGQGPNWGCSAKEEEEEMYTVSRSQGLRGLRHESSSLARTLGSWVRIPLKAWMFVCVYSVFVLFCVGMGLATGSSSVQGNPTDCV